MLFEGVRGAPLGEDKDVTTGVVLQLLNIVGLGLLFVVLKNSLPAYLSEKGKNLATKEDIEEITRKVEAAKAEIAIQFETSKTSLNKALHEFSTQFSRIDGQRASGILEIHGLMCDIEQLLIWNSGAVATAMISSAPEARSLEALNQAWEAIAKLNRTLNFHSLLLSDETYQLIQQWSKSAMAVVAAIGNEVECLRKGLGAVPLSVSDREAAIAAIRDKHLDALLPRLGDMRRRIGGEFRTLLAIQKPDQQQRLTP